MLQFLSQPSVSRYLIGAIFLLTGTLHFVKPGGFIHIMPNFIPRHKAMVYISGAAELLGGLGVMIPKTQWWAGWGLIILLIAVFPANINMSVEALRHQGLSSFYTILTLLRLPLQFVLISWVYWACVQ